MTERIMTDDNGRKYITTEPFKPDWDTEAVLVEEMQAKLKDKNGGMTFKCPEKFRVVHPAYGPGDEKNGMFSVVLKHNQRVHVIASNGMGWEHVSVSREDRCPTWDEMCQVKDLFWGEDDTVVQYHPPKSDYVNIHKNCLHLWRPTVVEMPRPPKIMVG